MKRYPLLLLALLTVLLAVPTLSQAAPTVAKKPVAPRLAPRDADENEELEAEEEEFEIEECEAGNGIFEFEEEEFEECEEAAEKKAGAVTAPEACRVRSAESSITMLPASDRVQLTVRYLTYKPSTVSLGLKLKDGKGSLKIETATEHLGKQGILHLTTKVSDAVMERAAKAKEFDVALRAPQTPGYCGPMLEQKLSAQHPVGDARVYKPRAG